MICPLGGIGRHKGLKIPRPKSRAGSSPAAGTTIWTNPKIINFLFLVRILFSIDGLFM